MLSLWAIPASGDASRPQSAHPQPVRDAGGRLGSLLVTGRVELAPWPEPRSQDRGKQDTLVRWCENPFSHPACGNPFPHMLAGWESRRSACEMGISHERTSGTEE